MFASLTSKENWQRYLKSLKYSLYVITHPIDGFWDLTHERRGSYAAANTILFLTILARILSLRYTSFIFIQVYWEELNILTYILSILFPLALFVIGNWALTTLFDGKGRLGQVYMATCYALTPYPLIHFPLMIFSNFITVDEAEFYSTMAMIALIWIAFIGLFGMSHDIHINAFLQYGFPGCCIFHIPR